MLLHPHHNLPPSLCITKYIYTIISALPVYSVKSSLKKFRSVLRQTSRRCHTFGLDTHTLKWQNLLATNSSLPISEQSFTSQLPSHCSEINFEWQVVGSGMENDRSVFHKDSSRLSSSSILFLVVQKKTACFICFTFKLV